MNSLLRYFWAFVVLLVMPLVGQEKFRPDTPLKDFTVPVFGDDGYRKWYFHGEEGMLVDEDHFEVVGMLIKTFQGGESQQVDTVIRSSQALVSIKENKAEGDAPIEVISKQFTLNGESWHWDGKNRKMTIDKNVRLVFKGNLDGILGL